MIVTHLKHPASVKLNDKDFSDPSSPLWSIEAHKKQALEEAGPSFEVVDAIMTCGDYACSWHFVIVLKATHSEEIRTYVYEEN